ncbi:MULTISPECIES: hypothetical protein [unclassified Streptomyces]|uniref:hypothetical protein n=1 Tax=unclassified Streptomyces TaxID=2593676 RepID=UPI002253E52D|nr:MULTISPECIES: hypothetical protein [unclassified Streptomyces]MCX4804024.1 hypothetical protein [Streptomyces sp. NBC_01214]WSR19446.1 hypothetical protein OG457_42975 [Streptomyces sp. NBC_01207]WTA23115.1 hypothetical protein OG365_36655 [Streptomyces sp. NBC_00853]
MTLAILRRSALAVTTLALSGAALAGVTAAPAQAAAPAAAAGFCHVSGLGGDYICEYGEAWMTYPAGNRQVFIVGTDFAVWTRWQYAGGSWSDWTSMGGTVRSGVRIEGNNTWNPTISIVGMDGERWSRHRLNSGSWTPWQN